ncbi:icd [Symbiodinium sp. KB8]|nr:icd [Symbiodinium sp. KB8]
MLRRSLRGVRFSSTWSRFTAPQMVYIAGEEMSRYTMELVMKKWVEPSIDTSKWEYYDLSCKARDQTNDQVLKDAVAAGARIGSIFKEPTITPTKEQMAEMGLSRALGSPNGAMRRGWNGITISRDTIHIPGIELGFKRPVLFERHAVGGEYGAGWKKVGKGRLLTTFFPENMDEGKPTIVDGRELKDDRSVCVVYDNPLDNVEDLAHVFFQRCLDAKVVPYVVTKKTVFKWQEGFWQIMREVFDSEYKAAFLSAGLLDKTGGELQHLISDAATMQIIRWTDGGFGMACHNYDGDMLTDEVAQVHRSPGFITSNLIGKREDGALIKEFEASHGTVADLWHAHLRGEETSMNPLGMVVALFGAMDHAAVLENDPKILELTQRFTGCARAAVYAAFRDGRGTRDMVGPNGLTTEKFVDSVAEDLSRRLVSADGTVLAPKAEAAAEPQKVSRKYRRNYKVDEKAMQDMFNRFDTDSSGKIDFEEFVELALELGIAPLEAEAVKAEMEHQEHKADLEAGPRGRVRRPRGSAGLSLARTYSNVAGLPWTSPSSSEATLRRSMSKPGFSNVSPALHSLCRVTSASQMPHRRRAKTKERRKRHNSSVSTADRAEAATSQAAQRSSIRSEGLEVRSIHCPMRWLLSLHLASLCAGRWSAERIRAWGRRESWKLGANYLPAHCANTFDLFDARWFDTTLLAAERELRIARAAGFSALRILLHEELFYRDGADFLDNVSKLLDVFHRQGMSTMLVLFDACWRPDSGEPGEDLYIPGVHNSASVQCPTHTVLRAFGQGEAWAKKRLHQYVTAVVGRFATDPRVAIWDIYNEPTMRQSEHLILPRLAAINGWAAGSYPEHWLLDGPKLNTILPLVRQAFEWAREVNPVQPLTTAVWDFPNSEDDEDVKEYKAAVNSEMVDLSDIISIHCYCSPDELEQHISELAAKGRGPVLVTEFMARPRNSTLTNSLPVLRRQGAWGYTWGLFQGRSNTHVPWNTWLDTELGMEGPWFHDVFYGNGTAYSEEELKEIWWHTTGSQLRL